MLLLGEGGDDGAWVPAAKAVAVDNLLIYTWTNFHMRDFLLNFLLSMKEVRGGGGRS